MYGREKHIKIFGTNQINNNTTVAPTTLTLYFLAISYNIETINIAIQFFLSTSLLNCSDDSNKPKISEGLYLCKRNKRTYKVNSLQTKKIYYTFY